jgi:SAM-dependent methyltransferase
MTHAEQWLAAVWPVVRRRLPTPPARVLEIGCGPLGGFVPMLRSSGYEAVGVDPNAPAEASYRRVEFEQAEPFKDLDAVVASTSLHHVADPADVLDRIAGSVAPGGAVVVVEWAWETFDEATAQWGFERLGTSEDPGWLHRRRDDWLASGRPWTDYLRGWAVSEGLHSAGSLLRLLDQRFEREQLERGPYLFPALRGTRAEDEQAAIAAGRIRALRVDYSGTLRRGPIR